ncbi:hypothetical protein SteCoe_29944 [Stentor coeruleus]|uniref:Uncharacterized protein n=1 Tax=Stentor coeruleus TaxID=5963 RepID=A0A1R2B4Q8_9CILI|nr:hypothetical protein SteCoe_29944 [Stentor coeruleus]
MESNLYSYLEILNNTMRQNLQQSELDGIIEALESSLCEGDYLKKEFKNDSIFVFAIEKFLSLRNSNFSDVYIEDKLTCLNILKNKIPEDFFEAEAKKIKREFKIKAFDLEFSLLDFRSFYKVIESNPEFLKLLFDSDNLESYKNARNALNFLMNFIGNKEYLDSEKIKLRAAKLFDVCKQSKKSFIKKLGQALGTLINKSKLSEEIKSSSLSLFKELTLKYMEASKIENLCIILDKAIKNFLVVPENPDDFDANFGNHNLVTLKIDKAIIENDCEVLMRQATTDFLNYSITLSYENLIYINFDTMFTYTISKLLMILKDYASYELLKSNAGKKHKGFNFSKAYYFLKNLPIHVSQTVLEILCHISDYNLQQPLLQYFLKDMYKLQYQKISLEESEKFITLALKSPIAEVLQRFNKSSLPLEEILRSITPTIYFMTFPKKISGITLKTQLISIKIFEEIEFTKDHKFGGYFIIYLHELGNFLQKARFGSIDESNRKNPEFDSSRPQEGGKYLEKILFGEVQNMIYSKQSEYLIKGGFPNSIEAFIKQYNESKINDKMEPLLLGKSQNILVLGRCLSIYGGVEEYFSDILKNKH